MAFSRAAFAASAAALAFVGHAQMLAEPNLDKLRFQAASWNATFPRDEQAENEAGASGFSNPTLCDSSVKQTSGYIPVSASSKYFFWLFEAKTEDPSKAPLLVWLSGGPGCSSQLALFAENGPCKVDKSGESTTANPFSWHNAANVMWIDQPSGVGFSTGFGVKNEKGVAANMYTFFQGFFKQFPQYGQTDLYIFGESYAGHYVPAITHQIWKQNKAGTGVHIPLKGLAIGNGLTDPAEQYKWYPEMGHTGGQAEGGHAPAGVISKGDYVIMKGLVPACELGIAACNKGVDPDPQTGGIMNATACLAAYDACNFMSMIPYELTGKNPYDMRIKCEHGRLCYDFDMITTYLNKAEVQKELGVSKKWGSCNMAVDLAFVSAGDWLIGYHTLIPDMLEDGIEVLIYAGDVDYICNWLGNKAWTQKLQWAHTAEFNAAKDNDYSLDGKTVAKVRSANGFHFMQVFEAGHMVPMDQPKVALQMVKDFVSGKLQSRSPAANTLVV
eukprot:TRINITY_DN1687_c0_g3_i1.p1 TRINITY_DN1687_c0_g3~~TRINITY_DN1687_c0_g3_i1.p1  ORF type:complete len:499 (+),score=125.32 TRINITY_DN1687_c0_g3_i1:52-1548(+)